MITLSVRSHPFLPVQPNLYKVIRHSLNPESFHTRFCTFTRAFESWRWKKRSWACLEHNSQVFVVGTVQSGTSVIEVVSLTAHGPKTWFFGSHAVNIRETRKAGGIEVFIMTSRSAWSSKNINDQELGSLQSKSPRRPAAPVSFEIRSWIIYSQTSCQYAGLSISAVWDQTETVMSRLHRKTRTYRFEWKIFDQSLTTADVSYLFATATTCLPSWGVTIVPLICCIYHLNIPTSAMRNTARAASVL